MKWTWFLYVVLLELDYYSDITNPVWSKYVGEGWVRVGSPKNLASSRRRNATFAPVSHE